jgi:hypothetical protein
MRTIEYNPSPIEVEFAEAISKLKEELEKHLTKNKIDSISNNINADNPLLKIDMTDTDGDKHRLVIKLIQKPDQF